MWYNKTDVMKEGAQMSELCFGCMEEYEGEEICPNCGYVKGTQQESPFLPINTVLQERYIIGKVLSSNSESAKYIGYDKFLNSRVTLKEFLPQSLCTRGVGETNVTIKNGDRETFSHYEEKFLGLFRSLTKFKELSAIVPVFDIFTENNTSYVVEEAQEVILFAEYVQRSGGTMEWDMARPLFMPLLSSLSTMSQNGLHHFGICPASLVVTPEGKIKLTNFSITDVRQVNNEKLSHQLFSGCSAPEQYEKNGILDEATDVYGFTAALFYALTGNLPEDAEKRKENSRLLISTNVVKRLPPHVITALANGLQLNKEDRICDFETLRAQLSAAPTVKAIQEEIAKPAVPVNQDEFEDSKKHISNFACGVIAMIIGLIVFAGLGYYWLTTNPFDGVFAQQNTSSTSETQATEATNLPEDFTYPKDSKFFRVPSFIGKTFEEAEEMATATEEYRIVKAVDEVFSDTVAEGFIAEQTPTALNTVDRGNDGVTISVAISKGSKIKVLPDIEKKDEEKVAELLANEHLLANTVLEFSDTIEAGKAIGYKDANKGDKVEYGSEITVRISLGKKPTSSTNSSSSSSSLNNSSDAFIQE